MGLRVIEPGLYSLLVGRGRAASRHLGVPVGGPADSGACALGNGLLGNPPDALALEVSLLGPTLRADCDLGAVVFGAPFQLSGGFETGRSFKLAAGETLKIGGTPGGCRAYFCVAGGFRSREILGSQSAFEPIRRGDVLDCTPSTLKPRAGVRPSDSGSDVLRVLPGPQRYWFPDANFFEQSYTVSPASNRMGVRLLGLPLVRPPRELASEPVAPGAVQITNDGLPVILGVDGQTIGGYPKIAHVIRADHDRLGQLRPGKAVRFVEVTAEEAEAAYRAKAMSLRRTLAFWRVEATRPDCGMTCGQNGEPTA